MRYNEIKDKDFRRIVGIYKETFLIGSKIIDDELSKKKGRKNKLTSHDMLLMLLEYYRRNTTYIELATMYGISESAVSRNIRYYLLYLDTLLKDLKWFLI